MFLVLFDFASAIKVLVVGGSIAWSSKLVSLPIHLQSQNRSDRELDVLVWDVGEQDQQAIRIFHIVP